MQNIITALCEFQKTCPSVPKNGKNPHFNSSYMILEDILAAVRQPLAAKGLCVVQTFEGENLKTTLFHVSGESISSLVPLKQERPGPQAFGSVITYNRRYALCSLLGIADVDDDDGNAGDKPPGSNNPKVAPKTNQPVGIDVSNWEPFDFNGKPMLDDKFKNYKATPQALKVMFDTAIQSNWTAELQGLIKEHFGIEKSNDMNGSQINWVCKYMTKYPQDKAPTKDQGDAVL